MGICSSSSHANGDGGYESDIGRARLSFRRGRGRVDNKLKDLGGYLPLYKAALRGDWNEARLFLDEDPEAMTANITINSETALHIAVGTGEAIDFVEKLVRRMSPEDLAVTDQNGETALSVAAMVGNVKGAKLLVNKNPDLPNISGKSGFPIHRAAEYGQKDMVRYLLVVTRDDIEPSPFAGQFGGQLLIAVILANFFDIALELVERFPEMATVEVNGVGSPLTVLASKSSAFPSGYSNDAHWGRLFYNPVASIIEARRRKMSQDQALKFLKCLCKEICELDDARAFSLLQQPLHLAAKLGIPEIVEEIVEAFPHVIWSSDEDKRNVFQLAVLNRRENVFNLIHQMSNYRHLVTRYIDYRGNNMLHLAAQLPSSDRLNLVSGAALQVQRELQWFKEVEKHVQPAQKEAKNKDGKTPVMVFIDAHQQLMKDGEEWLKHTATSCTVVATLIATMVFSATIQVPGGNDSENGHPVFAQHRAFDVFAVVDAVSLFSSVASILMFLSILTSRYSIDDFLNALPKAVTIGLSLLFLSILTMMMAFSVAIELVFGPKKAKVLIPVGSFAVLVVALPVLLPLLWRIAKSTYGRGIFTNQKRYYDRMLH